MNPPPHFSFTNLIAGLMSVTDAQSNLVEQAKAGDQPALELLLLEHSDTLFRYISQRLPASLRSVIGAEDVMQQTLIRAFDKIDQLQGSSSRAFVAWLKAISTTALMRIIETERRQKRGGGILQVSRLKDPMTDSIVSLLEQVPSKGKTASRVMGRREAVTALQIGISSLPLDQRQAIELHLLCNESLEETARQMHRTPAAVRGLIYRGKQRLAETMGRASMWLSGK